MANMTAPEANRVLDASWGVAPYVNPTPPVNIRLMSAVGTDTTPGTEVVGGGYAAQPVNMTGAAGKANQNSAALTYPNMPAVTVNGVEQWDSAGAPFRRWYGALTAPKTTNAGDTFSIAAGALTAAIA